MWLLVVLGVVLVVLALVHTIPLLLGLIVGFACIAVGAYLGSRGHGPPAP